MTILPCGHKNRGEKYGERRCRSCYDREYYMAHPERRADNAARVKAWKQRRRLRGGSPLLNTREQKRNFKLRGGLTVAEYDRLLAKQGGKCAICGKLPGLRRFCVDHNHKTGTIRGLLCFTCNYGLGWFRDNKTRLMRAADYLGSGEGGELVALR